MFVRLFVWMFAGCLVLFWPAMAPAHETNGPHGGLMTDAGPYHVELIAKENQLRVFVFDDKSSPVQTKNASATATVLVGQEKHTVTLQPGTDDNLMVGQFGMNTGSGLRIVVLIQLPGKPSIVARFAF